LSLSNRQTDLLLYHSFPRRSTSAQIASRGYKQSDANTIGLDILRSLISNGILLTPEKLKIPQNRNSQRADPPGPLEIIQRRACFTLLRQEELLASHTGNRESEPFHLSTPKLDDTDMDSHVQIFGDFSVALDPIEARELGIMPVFYYYRVAPQKAGKISVSQRHFQGVDLREFGPSSEILFRLAELRALVIALAQIEALGAVEGRPVYPLDRLWEKSYILEKEPGPNQAISLLNRSLARSIYNCIDTDRVPAWNIIEWIDILLNAFQIADDSENLTSLAYYQQREWRIIQMFSPLLDCHSVHPHSDLHDAKYFNNMKRINVLESIRSHSSLQGFTLDLDNTFILSGTNKRPFRSFIREIICPLDCAEQVIDLVSQLAPELNISSTETKTAVNSKKYTVLYLKA
jgi:hypothetical protein